MKEQIDNAGLEEACPEYLSKFDLLKVERFTQEEEVRKRIGNRNSCEMLEILVNTNVWNGADELGHLMQYYMWKEYEKSKVPIATYHVKVVPFEDGGYEQKIQVDLITHETKLLFNKPEYNNW